jgi:hypothetical protein
MESFTRLEWAVLEKLTADGPPLLESLRQQLAAASVSGRKLTGVGCFTEIAVPADVPKASIAPHARLTGVGAQMPSLRHGAGFVLFLKNGVCERLEGFTYDEPWPDRIDEFTLTYVKLPRDFSSLMPH